MQQPDPVAAAHAASQAAIQADQLVQQKVDSTDPPVPGVANASGVQLLDGLSMVMFPVSCGCDSYLDAVCRCK